MPPSKTTIELLVHIAHLGKIGDIVEVSTAQARNLFIPKKMAREITPERLKQIELEKKRAQDQARLRLLDAYKIQEAIDGQILEFTLKGKNGKVFGGLDEHAIINRVKHKWGYDFEKSEVKLPNRTHIKTVGTHLVYIHITKDTLAKIQVEVKLDA